MRKYQTIARPKTSWANFKLCISTSNVKMFFRGSPTPFSFIDFKTLLFHGLVPLPISSSPRQGSHDSAILTSRILQGNPGFNFTASCTDLLKPPFRNNPDACLATVAVFTLGGYSIDPFFYP